MAGTSERLLSLLLDNGVLAPLSMCRMVCKAWCVAFDSRQRNITIREFAVQERSAKRDGGAIGKFLRKLPRLESVSFQASFRKGTRTRAAQSGGDSTAPSALAARKRRQAERQLRVSGSWAEDSEGDETDCPQKRSGGTLRELEQMRLLVACDALKGCGACKISFPFCRISASELREVLAVLAAEGRVRGLENLDLRGNFFGVEGARVLAGSCTKGDFNSLRELDVSSNDLMLEGLSVLTSSLSFAPNLRRLKLGENGLDNTEAWAALLAKLVAACPALEELEVDKGHLGGRCIARFFASMAASTTLRTLRLTDTKMESAGPELLSPLASSASIAVLSLQRNHLTSASAVALAAVSEAPQWPMLRELDLSHNSLGGQGARAIADGLARGALQSIAVLALGFNQLREAGATALSEALGEHRSLLTLSIPSNAIRADGGIAVAGLLCAGRSSALTALDVSNNALDANGVAAIARGAAESVSLRVLNAAFNSGSVQGAVAFGDAFARLTACREADGVGYPHALEELDLSYNCFGVGEDSGAEWVRTLLLCCPLQRLNLAYNLMGDALAGAVGSAVRAGGARRLTTLHARGNRLTRTGLVCLREAWSGDAVLCQRVDTVDVQDNLTVEGAEAGDGELDLERETRAALGAVQGGVRWGLCPRQVL